MQRNATQRNSVTASASFCMMLSDHSSRDEFSWHRSPPSLCQPLGSSASPRPGCRTLHPGDGSADERAANWSVLGGSGRQRKSIGAGTFANNTTSDDVVPKKRTAQSMAALPGGEVNSSLSGPYPTAARQFGASTRPGACLPLSCPLVPMLGRPHAHQIPLEEQRNPPRTISIINRRPPRPGGKVCARRNDSIFPYFNRRPSGMPEDSLCCDCVSQVKSMQIARCP